MAHIHNRFKARPHANLKILDSFSNGNNDTCAFVARALRVEGTHLGSCPVIEHEMDVTHTETGGVDFYQYIFGARNRDVHILDFLCGQYQWLVSYVGMGKVPRGNQALRSQQRQLYIVSGSHIPPFSSQ
jgi:hypothetical protein